jgi:hypothetical protein
VRPRSLTLNLLAAESREPSEQPADFALLDDLFGNPLEGLFE